MTPLVILDVLLGFVGLYLLKTLLTKRQPPVPPGPRPIPLLGNLFDVPQERPWEAFIEWGKKWGPILSISIFGQRIVILNSAEDAIELLDKKGAKYSNRPTVPMAKLVGWDQWHVFTLHSDERFRYARKIFHQAIGSPASMSQYYHIVEQEAHRFIQRVLVNPAQLADHIRMNSGSIIIRISYGYKPKETNDNFVNQVGLAMEHFSEGMAPGTFLVNVIPALSYLPEWFPGTGFKRRARSWAKNLQETVDLPYNLVKEQMALGTAEPSLTTRALEDMPDTNAEDEATLKWTISSLYAGGADTTVAAVHAFFKAMVLFPEAQRKAQAELDSVVGNDRLPTCRDRDRLPYFNALTLEVLRWHSVAAGGVAHTALEDNVFKGHFIPKGATILTNIWEMAHDPTVYHDPMTFNPDRFLSVPGRNVEPDPRTIVFGFGRRICPGKILADTSIFLACAMTLAVFNISPYVENGKPVLPDTKQMSGLVSHPSPFKYTIKPRSEAAQRLIGTQVAD